MSSAKHKTSFEIEGVFLQFETGDSLRDGRAVCPKALWVATPAGEHQIKLAKSLRTSLKMNPQPGDWVKMTGHRTINLITGEVKLKAYLLQPLTCGAELFPAELKLPVNAKTAKEPAKAKVLVCQKSDCRARGSQAVQQAIADQLQACGLADQVTVKATGCMGCCKKGANVVFMPDKARYQQVKPAQVPALVEKHLAAAPTPLPANTIRQTATSAPSPKRLTAVQA